MTHSLQRPLPSGLLVAVVLNAIFLATNGLYMLIAPMDWFQRVPGVVDTGGFNQHFIRDIGLVQLLLGVAFAIGLQRPAVRIELWSAASLWLVAHALFHFWEVAIGICSPSAIPRDFPAVTLPALIGVIATAVAWKQHPPSRG